MISFNSLTVFLVENLLDQDESPIISEKASKGTESQNHCSVNHQDFDIYIVGMESVFKFNLPTGAFSSVPSLNTGRERAAICSLGGKVFVAGGVTDNGQITNSVEFLDVENRAA